MAVHPSSDYIRDVPVDQPADGLRCVVGSYPILAITDDEIIPSSDDSSPAHVALPRLQEACFSLRFHMDNSVWDVVHEEVMDWRDSSWTSMNLPGKKTCANIVQPCAIAATEAMLILASSLHPMPPFLGRPGTNGIGEQ